MLASPEASGFDLSPQAGRGDPNSRPPIQAEATSRVHLAASPIERIQHPLQMLGTLPSSSLSRSRTVALAERRDLDAAYRVRLIFTALCTGNVR
jgi:hypothetical protein